MKLQAFAVVGSKKSGKTTTIENLIRELVRRGYNVAAIKHISESNHTIDKPGKDTWRYTQAGAKTVVSAAANEIAIIEKTTLELVPLDLLIKRCRGNDIVFIEGLKKKVAKRRDIPKIVTVRNVDEAISAVKNYTSILAFSGSYSTDKINVGIPYANAVENPVKLADIVENKISEKKSC